MVLKVFRWAMGYVRFEAYGENLKEFINYLRKANINLWNLKKINGKLYASIIASEYKEIAFMAKKSNSKIKMKKKHGLPFWLFKYRKRWGIVAGMLVFSVVIYCSSLYIWNVKVIGNSAITAQEVINVMAQLGVSPGTLKSRINSQMVQQMAMAHLENISWISVNIDGSCAEVSLKEKITAPKIMKAGEPCNIVAQRDGQIERFETYSGTAVATAGDVVTKGQLLISGVVEGPDGKNFFVNSNGKVFAKTKRSLVEKVSLDSLKATDTGKSVVKYRVKIFGLEIPIPSFAKTDDTFRCEMETQNVVIFNLELPVKIHKEIWYEQKCDEIHLTVDQANNEARKNMAMRETTELDGVQILEKSVKFKEERGEYILESELVCMENIGTEEKISFE